MRRTEQLQGLRLMKFEEVYGRTYGGELSQSEAAEVLGVSERTFRRWRPSVLASSAPKHSAQCREFPAYTRPRTGKDSPRVCQL